MSIISNVHTLVPFVAGESKPFDGQRLLRIGFKTTKAMEAKGIKALPSVCASVPYLTPDQVRQELDALLPHIGAWLETVQDGAARALYEGSKGQRKDIRSEEIDIPALVAFLSAQEAGSRLSAESIKAWFLNGPARDISAAIILDALKYGDDLEALTEEQRATVEKHVLIYCEVFQMLAGKKLSRASFGDKQWHRLGQILGLLTGEDMPDDPFAARLVERMDIAARTVVTEDMI